MTLNGLVPMRLQGTLLTLYEGMADTEPELADRFANFLVQNHVEGVQRVSDSDTVTFGLETERGFFLPDW